MLLKIQGFSLIEVLISLMVVSLTAVNITGLQKKILDQQRNNIAHSAVISMVTQKMEKILVLRSIDDLMAMDNTSEKNVQVGHTRFNIDWNVNAVDSKLNAGVDFKEVEMDISWVDAVGVTQNFKHAEQVNLTLLLSGTSNNSATDTLAGIVASTLQTNEVIYFEPKMSYQKGSFVIHDSYLYQATAIHSAGNEHPRTIIDPSTGISFGNDGWESHGRIDNPALISHSPLVGNTELATLFLE